MLGKMIGSTSTVGLLKAGMDVSSRAVRGIAHRVANASSGQEGSFANTLDAARIGLGTEGESVDLEAEMVRLADEQLRFEATSRLLQKVYQNIRSSIRSG